MPECRSEMEQIIQGIVKGREQISRGTWRGLGDRLPSGNRASGTADFIIKGSDVVVAKDGRFVTVLKDGINNMRVKCALARWDKK